MSLPRLFHHIDGIEAVLVLDKDSLPILKLPNAQTVDNLQLVVPSAQVLSDQSQRMNLKNIKTVVTYWSSRQIITYNIPPFIFIVAADTNVNTGALLNLYKDFCQIGEELNKIKMLSSDDYYVDEYTDGYDDDTLFTYQDWIFDEKTYFDDYLPYSDGIRGVQMCLMMKMISFSIDYKYFEQTFPSPNENIQQLTEEQDTFVKCLSTTEFLSYMLSINNTVFGPWLNYRNYIRYFQTTKNLVVIRKIDFFELIKWFYCLFKICLCLIISNCFTDWFQQITFFFDSHTEASDSWTNAYFQALTYRFSHYCICFIGELFGLISGIEFDVEEYKNYQEIYQQYKEKINENDKVVTEILTRKKSHEKKNKQLSKKYTEQKEDQKLENIHLTMPTTVTDSNDPVVVNTVEPSEINKGDIQEDTNVNIDERNLNIPQELMFPINVDTTDTMNNNRDDNIEADNSLEKVNQDSDKMTVYPQPYRSPIIRRSSNSMSKKKSLTAPLKKKLSSSRSSFTLTAKQQPFVATTKKSSELVSLCRSSSIVKPYEIELPHSLVDVVINWNIPMHYWLKIYVYKPMKLKYGHFLSIFVTYLASALLHGFNFQLSIVLLSIGIFAYVEYGYRKKLSNILDSCVMAKNCLSCDHSYKYWHPLTFTVNCLLSVLSLWHLTYLGQLFDNSQQQYIGYSLQHTLEKWSKLNFASHIVVICTYAIFRSL
ncbi:unnamed protein product [Didymodactylos carnosus]|uniref:Protein-serine O-palmitoleoyltransferase porcupine n=2 Tax=Didymodactylos carnosus TaxID=1234261 RepID=A0A814TEE0_9BILA|nr:unnamed protein product [Didymodactylos carnosus]CAF3923793.1 unnamed protein product [Didymodactylos carnosus]